MLDLGVLLHCCTATLAGGPRGDAGPRGTAILLHGYTGWGLEGTMDTCYAGHRGTCYAGASMDLGVLLHWGASRGRWCRWPLCGCWCRWALRRRWTSGDTCDGGLEETLGAGPRGGGQLAYCSAGVVASRLLTRGLVTCCQVAEVKNPSGQPPLYSQIRAAFSDFWVQRSSPDWFIWIQLNKGGARLSRMSPRRTYVFRVVIPLHNPDIRGMCHLRFTRWIDRPPRVIMHIEQRNV